MDKQDARSTLIAQWRRLILPPEPYPTTGGEQLDSGNRYPDAGTIDLPAHVVGDKTFAVDLAYGGSLGLDTKQTRAGVLDIDEGPASIKKARALYHLAVAKGLSAAVAWSGRKGCHVWVFTEPVAVETMRTVLKSLKSVVPHRGELVPLDAQRVKLAPGWHREGNAWAFWYRPDETPAAIVAPPDGFLAGQVAILAAIEPTPARVMQAIVLEAYGDSTHERADPDTMIPDLAALGATAPACIAALVRQGGSDALGTFNKNSLTLARYCHTVGLDEAAGRQLAAKLIEDPAPDIESGKDRADRERNWASTWKTPSVCDPDQPFSCLHILGAKKKLGFDCATCPARPEGVWANGSAGNNHNDGYTDFGFSAEANAPLQLEPALADRLLRVALEQGDPGRRIERGIFPLTEISKGTSLPIHAVVWAAVCDGARHGAAVAAFVDAVDFGEHQSEVTQTATALVERLRAVPPVAEDEATVLINRAADMSARLRLVSSMGLATTQAGQAGADMAAVAQDLHQAATELEEDRAETFGAPLTAYADELLEGLVESDAPAIATPFPRLNDLLGGGLRGGKLYVLGAPPGGGKTTLASQIADAAAEAGTPVAFAAFEMGRGQLFDYALAREAGMNSFLIESRAFKKSANDEAALEAAAKDYLTGVGPFLSVIEGDYGTTAAVLATWAHQARVRYELATDRPLLIIVDYLQLMNSGIDAIDTTPSEVQRITEVAVQLKRLARETGAAVLALSDVNREEAGKAYKGDELSLNAYRGSNRIGHAADVGLVLYSDTKRARDGSEAVCPWAAWGVLFGENVDVQRGLEDAFDEHRHVFGQDGATVTARLQLLKNRGGRGRGNQLLLYERAYHRFQPVDIDGQASAERGR